MSVLNITVLDSERALHGEVHGSVGLRFVAALTDAPETIAELAAAFQCLTKADERMDDPFSLFREGIEEEPYDAGVLILDLAAQIVASDQTYFGVLREGELSYDYDEQRFCTTVPYYLPEDWIAVGSVDEWRHLRSVRASEVQALRMIPVVPARVLLYEKLPELLAEEAANKSRVGGLDDHESARQWVREVHEKWLTTPRNDLDRRTLKDILLEGEEESDFYTGWRRRIWDVTDTQPMPLPRDSRAYRCAPIGRHERILYNEMTRELLLASVDRIRGLASGETIESDAERGRLEELRDSWLSSPTSTDLSGFSPGEAIELERRRMPLGFAGEDLKKLIVDEDCPLCRAMAEGGQPTFIHLDGGCCGACEMCEQEFACPDYKTEEEWEAEMREFEEWGKNKAEPDDDEYMPVAYIGPWNRTFVDTTNLDALSPGEAASVLAGGIGGHITELRLDLEDAPEADPIRERFLDNGLEIVTRVGEGLTYTYRQILQQILDDISAVEESHPELEAKCKDLREKLERLRELLSAPTR